MICRVGLNRHPFRAAFYYWVHKIYFAAWKMPLLLFLPSYLPSPQKKGFFASMCFFAIPVFFFFFK